MSSKPLISVVTDSYNQARYIEACIKSVVNQDYPHLEYIVFDGGSSDGSVDIIKKYSDRISYWQSQPDGGQVCALRDGINRSTGEIVAVLDSDDELCPGALERVGEFFRDNPDCDWLVGGGIIRMPDGRETKLFAGSLEFDALVEDWTWDGNTFCQPSVFWRRSLWDKVGGFDEFFRHSFDYELWLKFSRNGRGAAIKDVLSVSNHHEDQKTRALAHECFVENCLILFKHGEKKEAFRRLVRVCGHTFFLARKFSFITRLPLYRKWRNRRQAGKSRAT